MLGCSPAVTRDPTRSALVVIDMQNDFLVAGGAFPRRHVEPTQLASTVAWMVAAARQQGRTIAWVTSAYGELPGPTEALRGHTHAGAPCCVPGSWGAALVAPLAALPTAGELVVTKRWYSAFRDTELHAQLLAAGVDTVVLCGVATNVCVLATARDARRLGLAVEVLADATAAATSAKHLLALREIEALGGRRRGWGELLAEAPAQVTGIGAGAAALRCGALAGCVGDDTYEALAREVDWQVMYHRGGEVPRRVAIQGARAADGVEPLYRHPVDEQPPLRAFTPTVDAIRQAVAAQVGHPLNHCLLQLYRDGRDWIGEHADKTLDLVRPSSIINVSLGRMRTMTLRSKRSAEGDPRASQRIPLPHGSWFRMDLETNRAMFHAIKQEPDEGAAGPRVSLTFRNIGTFWDPTSGAVWGVGAPTRDRAQAQAQAQARAALAPEAAAALERAEAEQMLRLFRDENQDPSFDADAYRPGFSIPNLRSMLRST